MAFVPDPEPVGRFVPDEVVPTPSKPSVSLGEITVGEDISGQVPLRDIVRHGVPLAAGLAGGMVPAVGLGVGPLAAITTDMAMAKLYGEGEKPESQRETSFLTDVAVGVAPYGIGKAAKLGMKLIPAPLEAKIASTIKYGIDKGIRPKYAKKSNFPQAEKYYEKAQSAIESIIDNKQILQYMDESGAIIQGQLPKNLTQFSQSIDQTKRSIFKQYDEMAKASQAAGHTVDIKDIVNELTEFSKDPVHMIAGGGGINRATELSNRFLSNPNPLTLTQAQDLLAVLNARRQAFLSAPTPDLVSTAAADSLTATRLRMAIDKAVDNIEYQPLRNQYGSLREIEKEVQNRATLHGRKNIKGLIDFADIASAAEAARAIATMNTGAGAAALSIKGIKEYYKYLNNPDRIIRTMFKDAEKLIGRRVKVPGATPPTRFPHLGEEIPGRTGLGKYGTWEKWADESRDLSQGGQYPIIPKAPRSRAAEEAQLGPFVGEPPKGDISRYEQVRYPDMGEGSFASPLTRAYAGEPPWFPPSGTIRALLPKQTPLPGSRKLLFDMYGYGASNPAYDMTDDMLISALKSKSLTDAEKTKLLKSVSKDVVKRIPKKLIPDWYSGVPK